MTEKFCIECKRAVHIAIDRARYALVAGNTSNEPIPPDSVARWLDSIEAVLSELPKLTSPIERDWSGADEDEAWEHL